MERPKSEQLRFENTYEALVDKTTWEIVQHIRQPKRRRANMAEQNIFSVLVYCMDCGGTMVLHRTHTMVVVKNNFMCATYKKKGKDKCLAHYIRESQLAEIIRHDLRRVTHFACQNELIFAKYITRKTAKKSAGSLHKSSQSWKPCAAGMPLFKRLYEDNVLGKIPNEVFRKLSDDYLAEQKEIQSSIPEREERLETLKSSMANGSVFLEKAKQYTQIDTRTAELMHPFY